MNEELLTGIKAAKEARVAAWKARQEFRKSPLSKFEKIMRAAMNEYHKMRAEGVSRDDAVKGIEAVLRDQIPMRPGRFESCNDCDGTGWKRFLCQHRIRCDRYVCGIASPDWEHYYVRPCDCALGDRFRPTVRTPEDTLAAVGRKKPAKSRGFRALSDA